MDYQETADGGLHACFDPCGFSSSVVAAAKIPGAIPVSYLRTHYGIDGGYPEISTPEWGPHRWPANGVIFTGKEDPPGAAEFYADFVPADWSAIKAVIAWDSPQMLAIHSARLFLSATCAHASNILIDAAARLYSIDHADVAKTDGSEIDMLFKNVARGTRAFDAACLARSRKRPCERYSGKAPRITSTACADGKDITSTLRSARGVLRSKFHEKIRHDLSGHGAATLRRARRYNSSPGKLARKPGQRIKRSL